jgi:hypothetical protein
LSIAREIVQAHGGQIWAESHPDQGTAFHILLPIAGAQSPRGGLSRAPRARPSRRAAGSQIPVG